MNGKLIVLEGLDGSGKSTQFELLKTYLNERKEQFTYISFPDYDQPSSVLVKMYLGGEFGSKPDSVNAYAASMFYAADRYACYRKFWETSYIEGSCVLAARYVTSNAIYQMTKLPEDKWDEYLEWLEDFEYVKLGLPKPDLVIFLDMPPEVSQQLLLNRYGGDEEKKDIHESNVQFLNKCRKAAEYAAKHWGWMWIRCDSNGGPRAISDISQDLQKAICELLDGT